MPKIGTKVIRAKQVGTNETANLRYYKYVDKEGVFSLTLDNFFGDRAIKFIEFLINKDALGAIQFTKYRSSSPESVWIGNMPQLRMGDTFNGKNLDLLEELLKEFWEEIHRVESTSRLVIAFSKYDYAGDGVFKIDQPPKARLYTCIYQEYSHEGEFKSLYYQDPTLAELAEMGFTPDTNVYQLARYNDNLDHFGSLNPKTAKVIEATEENAAVLLACHYAVRDLQETLSWFVDNHDYALEQISGKSQEDARTELEVMNMQYISQFYQKQEDKK